MVYKCLGCGGALSYSIATGQMHCQFCNSNFSVSEIEDASPVKGMMECNIFVCTECGASLAINDTESACFCGYCGQPTVVFERVSQMQKPDKIIPFKITREQAIQRMTDKYNKGFFVPKSFRKIQVDRVIPIYVPFRVYDIDYNDKKKVLIHADDIGQEEYRKVKVQFKSLTMDAALNLCNEPAQKLEPYDTNEMTDFKGPYLSGFYADCSDEPAEDVKKRAFCRCRKLYDDYMNSKISMHSKIASQHPDYVVLSDQTALLPAWFLSLRYRKRVYTILVNGETGKIIGSAPIARGKLWGVFLLVTGVLSLILPYWSNELFQYMNDKELSLWILTIYGALLVFVYFAPFTLYDSYKKNRETTTSEEMEQYARKRQLVGNTDTDQETINKKKKKVRRSIGGIILIIMGLLLYPFSAGLGLAVFFLMEHLGYPVGFVMAIGIGIFVTTALMCKSNDVGSKAGTFTDFAKDPIEYS